MEQPSVLCEEEQEPGPQKSVKETTQVNDEDSELIFVGVEHVNEDAELIFVGVTSQSKPVVSTILNRATPGSYSRRRKYGHLRQDPPCSISQPSSHMTPASKVATLSPVSPSEVRSTDSPIIIEPSSNPDYKNNSPQVKPNSASELCSPLIRFTSSLQHPGGAAFSVGGVNEGRRVSKQLSTSEVNSTNPKRPKLSDGVPGGHSLALSSLGISPTRNVQQNIPSKDIYTSLSRVQNRAPFPTAFPKDSANFKTLNLDRENGGRAKTDFSRIASENKTFDSQEGNLIVLLPDFYYGHSEGNGQPEEKTFTNFKCLSCLKVLKNVRFMNHMKHHLELERQRSNSWDSYTICQHCNRQFLTPFQLQRHIESVHVSQDPSTVCKICELSFETDHALLQHMKDTHKPGEMPYVCQVCNYRSSAFADVETHFRSRHENTKNLLCPFCLKIFKTAVPYMCHYTGHREKSVHQCSKCRLQFLTFKEKMEHKTQCHQMFTKPKQLQGLPPETKVVIQVSPAPPHLGSAGVASITVSSSELPPLGLKELPGKPINSSLCKSQGFQSKSKAPIKRKPQSAHLSIAPNE
ncbi:zinc finger protein 280B [Elephas maximus indicus]|uniref:zinc finger protein 280B n=1 Tax=Elephas maximus indicus TaxID=99487 RepID=UPI002116A7D5|nr:zinc finger protein 280B [Elephas maximus indicus]XP_049722767.1 zinc finger protein 280B [Elephas maximus indicus]XP_049722768.1 zinc finger protein 280B [Elephas maximus indicus]XP_049722769.1 zinc finger protein 280B [Elephas maximus indicus]XP_049722770.1 zinc finger protein 280B [Elephas maximus indicus]XP_049722771.1 zinc finger protein 280B [Elephas maximus indicus]XP_049722772.1 zinc finger protein 280B [Elephas maximus indicus]XP_049722773.1 zinc finger protein 280B [Elephas maxi